MHNVFKSGAIVYRDAMHSVLSQGMISHPESSFAFS